MRPLRWPIALVARNTRCLHHQQTLPRPIGTARLRYSSPTASPSDPPAAWSARRKYSSSPPSSSSVNASEISHFDALASTWWDPHGSSRVLHLMNPLRHDFIRSCHASQPDSNSTTQRLRYLDIGCGGGIFAESAARLPTTRSVTAIDPSTEVLEVARRHAARDPVLSRDRLRYLNATVEDLPDPAGPADMYDIVTLFEVVEHVDNPAAFLQRCGQLVKPGGWLILSTIARTWTSWLTTNLVAEDILRMVPKGTHDWTKYINQDELRAFYDGRAGWGSPRVTGVVYVPGLGWKEVDGSEKIGNYFFGVRKDVE